jgi:membrane protein involved in D-alanine export
MTPFSGLFFFCILIPALIPAVILGIAGKPIKYYGMLFTAAFLLYCFDSTEKRIALVAFWLLETVLVLVYLKLRKKSDKRYFLWIFLTLSLVPMLYIKMGPFVFENFLPILGVSYMSFRAIQVLIEIYDGLITDVKLFDFTYFLLFFPSVASGPIDRSRRFMKDINTPLEKGEYLTRFEQGVFKMFTGFLYNFVIARLIYVYFLQKLPGTGFLPTLGYMYGYIFYLFFDFAGYNSIALGVSYILGVKTPENFNMPFLSRDLKEFWSRWHISLSTWLRDYVYTRIVMNSLRKKTFKDPHTGSYIGYLATMMTMGIWHGLSLQYIIYGAYHGALMCLNDVLDDKWKAFKKIKREDKWHPVLSLVTFHIVAFGLLIFSGRLF